MPELDPRKSFADLVQQLKEKHDPETAMSLAVGGRFEQAGLVEADLLLHYGLRDGHYIIDVGCGSGRLASVLSKRRRLERLRYLGTDVVPDLVDHARQLAGRPDWKFAVVNEINIPEGDAQADFVCFFSVFTHLLHEHSYIYMKEAQRVLKPGGKIVFSFLEYAIHWEIFQNSVADMESTRPLNVFMSRDGIAEWARHLGLEIVTITPGDELSIPVTEPIVFEHGGVARDKVGFGQSFCVLTAPPS